jgi:hypothetical protein
MALESYKMSKKSKEQAVKGSTILMGKSTMSAAGKSMK